MSSNRGCKPTGKPREARTYASLTPEIYWTLHDIAKLKNVSVACVIREAAKRYIAEQAQRAEGSRS